MPETLIVKRLLLIVNCLLGLGLVVVAMGLFDPQPKGQLLVALPLEMMVVPAGQFNVKWLHEEIPAGNFTIRLTAAGPTAEPFVGYGLTLGRPESYLAVLVSPTGYVTMTPAPGRSFSDQWHTWPHIHPQSSNEIQIDHDEGNHLTIRINRELFWQGEWPLAGNQIGLVGQGFENGVSIDFQELALWGANLP